MEEEGSSPQGLTSSPPPPTHPTPPQLDLSSQMDIEQSSPVLPTLHQPAQPSTQRNESFLFSTDPI